MLGCSQAEVRPIASRTSGEMADALASGASVRKDVGAQVPPSRTNRLQISDSNFDFEIEFRHE